MTQSDANNDNLQFDIVEPTTPTPPRVTATAAPCAACRRPLVDTYFSVAGKPICTQCAATINAGPAGSRTGRLGLATLYGFGAAILGAIIWYTIRRVTNMEIGYVAILVGFLVGSGVRKGSGNRGGRAYQFLAIILTYCSIAGNYAPDVISAMVDGYHERHTTVATSTHKSDAGVAISSTAKKDANKAGRDVNDKINDEDAAPAEKPTLSRGLLAIVTLAAFVAAFSLAAPFLGGVQNIIGLAIIAFALFQAWKMNRARILPITGPYQLGSRNAGAIA